MLNVNREAFSFSNICGACGITKWCFHPYPVCFLACGLYRSQYLESVEILVAIGFEVAWGYWNGLHLLEC